MTDEAFKEFIWQQGRELYRDMPWRRDTRPYYVLVSELMLQQTQVARVIPKFEAFIDRFPSEQTLAEAGLDEVVQLWQGLGYNRRAQYLHRAVRMITDEFDGVWPQTQAALKQLPGVGENTAGAIAAYAFNQPAVYIETNIRTVFFHHFFEDVLDEIDDKAVRERVEATLDVESPREWYWALMDYGATLKQQGVHNNAQSRHYKKQAPLRGSVREVRGNIIALLVRQHDGGVKRTSIERYSWGSDERLAPALEGLVREGLIVESSGVIRLTK